MNNEIKNMAQDVLKRIAGRNGNSPLPSMTPYFSITPEKGNKLWSINAEKKYIQSSQYPVILEHIIYNLVFTRLKNRITSVQKILRLCLWI